MIWPVASLDDIAESIDYGFTASATTEPIGPKFLRITDIQDGHVDWQSVPHSSERPTTNNFHLRPGDIVFARTGATTGKSFLIRDCPANSIFASYLIRVRVSSAIDPLFLAHFFQSTDYWTQIRLSASGAVQPGVNSTVLRRLRVPLPPLDEQRRIATILDQADDLRRKRRLALEKLNVLPQAIFQEMFGGLASNGKGWLIKRLGDVVRVTGGFAFKSVDFADVGTGVVRISNLIDGNVNLSGVARIQMSRASKGAKYALNGGDILMAMSGATTGKVGVLPFNLAEPLFWNQRVANFRVIAPNAITREFLISLLSSDYYQNMLWQAAGGAAQPNISSGQLEDILIPIPPISMQNTFANRFTEIAQIQESCKLQLTMFEDFFSSLQYKAFANIEAVDRKFNALDEAFVR